MSRSRNRRRSFARRSNVKQNTSTVASLSCGVCTSITQGPAMCNAGSGMTWNGAPFYGSWCSCVGSYQDGVTCPGYTDACCDDGCLVQICPPDSDYPGQCKLHIGMCYDEEEVETGFNCNEATQMCIEVSGVPEYATEEDCLANCGGTNEIGGCTDHSACNYNSDATYDDGSCTYPTGCDLTCGSTAEWDDCGVCGGTGPDVICSDGVTLVCTESQCPESDDLPSCQCANDAHCYMLYPSYQQPTCAIDDINTPQNNWQCQTTANGIPGLPTEPGLLGTDVSPKQGVCIDSYNPPWDGDDGGGDDWRFLARIPYDQLLARKGGSIKKIIKRGSDKNLYKRIQKNPRGKFKK